MLYLRLFHERPWRDDGSIAALDDWGTDGPVLGPYPGFHFTRAEEVAFGEDHCLQVREGFVYYDAVLYGDWSVVDEQTFQGSPGLRALHRPFEPELAVVPESPSCLLD